MIAFLKGEIEELEETKVLLDVNGVGYGVFITGRDASALSGRRDRVKLFTYLQVREDAMQLYGFLQKDDLHVFQLLLGVNGIGPKAALGMLSALSANDIRFAVLAGDAKAIAKAPGVGPKTAQKMILELKDKFDLQETFDSSLAESTEGTIPTGTTRQVQDEAVQALVALGYPGGEALKAVRAADTGEDMNTEDLLKAALKKFSLL